jgi:hypothetical protein
MNNLKCTILLIILISLSGCASYKYGWNNYDNTLYQHYKSPDQNEIFEENLKNIVQNDEATGNIPPGIYAEYGYLLFERGQFNDAKLYFQKEYDKWPESRVFMTKILKITNNNIEKSYQKTPEPVPVK